MRMPTRGLSNSLLLSLLTIAVLLAGCGGDGGSGPLSADEYRTQADAACTDATKAATAVGSPADSAEGVQRYAEKLETILRDEGSALDELEPPDEMAATHRDLVDQIDKQADSLRAIAAAAAENDRQAATTAAVLGQQASSRVVKAAETLGLTVCSKRIAAPLGG